MVALAPPPAAAGISSENVIVVVNADSMVSRTIANHYVHLRDIPSSNVVFLEGITGDPLKISLDDFRTKVLSPVLNQINARGLAGQARVIAYSADFPTSVDISDHTSKLTDENQIKFQKPVASINGLTFMYRYVLADDPGYLGWASNLYARGPFERHFINPFNGQRRERFDKATEDLEDDRPKEAATAFAEMFDEHPLAPLAIRAAEAHLKAGDLDQAKVWIKKGVAAGWWSGTYLQETESFAPLREDTEIAAIIRALGDAPMITQQPIGFAGSRGWTGCGHAIADVGEGMPYMLSCMLAVVHPRGSTVSQATDVLERAAGADRTFPEASFWFTLTDNVRTKTRFPRIGDALLWMNYLNRDAQIIHSVMPSQPGKCAGLMLGTAKMTLDPREWQFVPGAISENLTSFNGHFGTSSQTKLTELLHAGAAMTSGPVAEPYALQPKFPLPMMYGFYASGVSAIEAFYLSVTSPYQLLIVGDPVCQPFARAPGDLVTAELITEPSKRIRFNRTPGKNDDNHTAVRSIETFLEGKLVRQSAAVQRIDMGFHGQATGAVEVRTVLVGLDPTEPRRSFSQLMDLQGPHPAPTAVASEDDTQKSTMSVTLAAQGADSIRLMHHGQKLGEINNDQGSLQVRWADVGGGPVRLRPVAHFGESQVGGKPIVVELMEE